MPRIRTIKPEFYRHEGLQDLESENQGKYVMLVYSGLWTQCDKNGVFQWRPRQLKLDILPFLNFDMADTLAVLDIAGYVKHYMSEDGKEYGIIPTFAKHQRLSGKEASDGEKFPTPDENRFIQGSNREATGKQQGSGMERTDVQEREREREREKERSRARRARVFIHPKIDDVKKYFSENGYSEEAAKRAYEYYDKADPPWTDSKGNKVRSWKSKMVAVWFKDENKGNGKRIDQHGGFDKRNYEGTDISGIDWINGNKTP